jgi:hypothetical protein
MGICESSHEGKSLKTDSIENNQKINDDNSYKKNNTSNLEKEDENNNQNSSNQKIEENKGPELERYDRSLFLSEKKRSEYSQINGMSVFSSGRTGEEVIIRGEINKECKNKEEDFDNSSFKNLVKNSGGKFVKNMDSKSNVKSSQRGNPILINNKDFLYDRCSRHTVPFNNKKKNIINNDLKANSKNINLLKDIKSEKIIKNFGNNFKDKLLRNSYKINVSMNDNNVRYNTLLSVPKIDEPLPDLDDLSTESPIPMGRNSLISNN